MPKEWINWWRYQNQICKRQLSNIQENWKIILNLTQQFQIIFQFSWIFDNCLLQIWFWYLHQLIHSFGICVSVYYQSQILVTSHFENFALLLLTPFGTYYLFTFWRLFLTYHFGTIYRRITVFAIRN
jgi:hypothetical protein